MNWRLPPSCRDEWGESYPLTLADRREAEDAHYAPVAAAAQWYYYSRTPCPTCGAYERAVNGRGEHWCRNCLQPVPARMESDADNPHQPTRG